ncbi:MAG: hypothetical protein WBE37_11155 [Bryobacteraceae bacterium]
MSKLFFRNALAALVLTFPIAALADTTGTPTLLSGSTLNLDTGATASGTSGGDLSWNGTSLTPQGSATAGDLAGTELSFLNNQNGYSTLVAGGQSFISTYGSLVSSDLKTTAITPAVSDVIIVHTNGGNYAAVLVTSIAGGSITLQFDTFVSAVTTPTGPSVTGITNNYSNLAVGLPNYGIAPGSLFVIYGTDLTAAKNVPSNPFPLATSLGGTSVSVTVNGTTVQPGLYYVYPTQIAAVLPSTTPTGTATITVTNGSQTSASFSFQVVQSAFGSDTLYGTGTGQAVVTDANYNVIGYTASASPGQTVIIWGSGVGADTKNDDKTYPLPNQDNLTNIPMTAYVGGVSATIVYRGRSQYPGVDQVVITIPPNVPAGCNVSVVLVSGNVASNFTTIAVNQGGGTCSDPNSPYNITSLSGDSTVSFGFLAVSQQVSLLTDTALARTSTHFRTTQPFTAPFGPRATPTTSNDAFGAFESIQGAELGNYASYETASIGSCVVYQVSVSSTTTTTPFTETGLDAGNITVTGPAGSTPLTTLPEVAGFYDASLTSSFIPSTGGAFTFNATGGTSSSNNVGPFSVTVNLSTPIFSWTNMLTTTSVTRSSGVTVNWQGGAPGTYVEISGYSDGNTAGAGFYCLAQQSALQFTVPSWVTLSLPAGSGELDVINVSNPVKFTATGLSFGYAYAEVDNLTEIPYN